MIVSSATLKILFTLSALPETVSTMVKTKRRLKDRFNEHRQRLDRPTPSSRPSAGEDHFISDSHSPNDIELVPLKLRHSSRDALRKAREAERGQTLEPKGIKQTRKNLILCLTHLYLMYYTSFYYLVFH